MLKSIEKKLIILSCLVAIYVIIFAAYSKLNFFDKELNNTEKLTSNDETKNMMVILTQELVNYAYQVVYENTFCKIVWDGLTMGELTDKLNRTLNSTLAGKGEIFATHSLELGIDPYLAVAIVMEETGCKWDCSYLVKACNNVGGQKGSPSCNGGSYKAYNSLDEGIIGYLDNLYYNYYAYGLTTAEAMNPKYAANPAWSANVNAYIERIKAA